MPSPEPTEPVTAPPAENPPPPLPQPSLATAGWLLLTLLNIALFVFLVPESMLEENKRVLFLIKIFSAVAAAGAFAAGLLWFKTLLVTLPERRGFKIAQVVILCILLLLQVSQQNVISTYPQIEPEGAILVIDGTERHYEAGEKVRLSFGSHTVKITPKGGEKEKEFKEREFPVSYSDVFFAIFKEYRPQWGLLYQVTIITRDANVSVLIKKTDGGFGPDFWKGRAIPGISKPKAGSPNEFVFRSPNASGGSFDDIYLPYGEYDLTASTAECPKPDLRKLRVGTDAPPYTVAFDPLCEQ